MKSHVRRPGLGAPAILSIPQAADLPIHAGTRPRNPIDCGVARCGGRPGPGEENDPGGSRRSRQGCLCDTDDIVLGGISDVPGLIDPDRMPGACWLSAWRRDDSESPLAFGGSPLADRGAHQAGLTEFNYGRHDLRPAGIVSTGRPVHADSEDRAACYGRGGNGDFPGCRSGWQVPLHHAASGGWAIGVDLSHFRPQIREQARGKQAACARPARARRRQPFRGLPGPGTLTAAGDGHPFCLPVSCQAAPAPLPWAAGPESEPARAEPGFQGALPGLVSRGADPVEGLPHAHLLIADFAEGTEHGSQRAR